MTRHYLDHASTSPIRPEALAALTGALERGMADPGRVHTEGRQARVTLEHAREQVAALVGARPREVVFTSGATEAINAAVFGASVRWAEQHGTGVDSAPMAAADVEHSAVLQASQRCRRLTLGVDGDGRVEVESVREALAVASAGTGGLVHVQWANHEVGTLQPVAEVVEIAHAAGFLVHVDAAQAAGHVPVDFAGCGADLMSISGHKLGGPTGTGALLVRRGLRLPSFVVGGEQERARRGGMENVAALVGFGAAADAVSDRLTDEAAASFGLTAAMLQAALAVTGVRAYGDVVHRLPHIVCVGVDGVESEAVLLGLDQAGVAAHSGSACSSESLEPSPVLQAMGVEAERSLRVSTGWSSTDDDVEAFTRVFPEVVARLRSLRT